MSKSDKSAAASTKKSTPVKRAPKRAQNQQDGKIRRFITFLGIKKKRPQNFDTSPELQRYELDLFLEDIQFFAGKLPAQHPRKSELTNAIQTLEHRAQTDIKKAIELASGILKWAQEAYEKAEKSGTTSPPSSLDAPPFERGPEYVETLPQSAPAVQPAMAAPSNGNAAVREAAPASGQSLKQFKLDKALGSGQFATTYKMTGPDGTALAVKVPKAKAAAATPKEREKQAQELAKQEAEFKREAEFYQKVGDHPNFAKCYGYQTVGEGASQQTGLVLEMIDGKTANDAVGDMRGKYLSGEVSAEEYWGVVQYTLKQLLQAADHMGKCGVSHRDIKPDNVIIDSATGSVKLIDFGVSQRIGEPTHDQKVPIGFVPPELMNGAPATAKEDPFGVGATGYMWSEQDRFDYKPGKNKTLVEGLKEYGNSTKSAIEVNPPRTEDATYERLRKEVKKRLKKWEKSLDDNDDKSLLKELKDLATQGQEHGDKAEFSQANKLLRDVTERIPHVASENEDEERYEVLLNEIECKVDIIEDQWIEATSLWEPNKLKSLLVSVRPLLKEARRHGDNLDYGPALAILQEASSRIEDSERKAGKHQAETLYTDFINQLMHPDASKRLSPEEALKHPFLANTLLDEEGARRVLQMQNASGEAGKDPGKDAPEEKRWQALNMAVLEAERQLKAVKSGLPAEAAERQVVVAQMKALTDQSNREKLSADQAWERYKALDSQFQPYVLRARKDQEERRLFQADLAQTARLLKALSKPGSADTSDFADLFKKADAASKPGGSLAEARKLLGQVKARMDNQFDHNARTSLVSDGIKQAEAEIDLVVQKVENLKKLGVHEKKIRKYQERVDEARKILENVTRLVESPVGIDEALSELDRASELLLVSLANASGGSSAVASEPKYINSI